MSEKPDHIEIITKEELLNTVRKDLDTLVEAIQAESSHVVSEHTHNVGTAYRLSEMWGAYADKLQTLIRVRSASEKDYDFIRDVKTGLLGFKHHRQPWEAMDSLDSEKPTPAKCRHDHGPSGTEAAYR